MRHKNVKLTTLLLLGLGLTGLQAQTIYVKQTSGTQTAYSLSDIKKMNFSSGNITVSKTKGIPDTYPLSGIRYLNFQDLTTNISMVEKQEVAVQVYPNPVVDVLNIRISKAVSQAYFIQILSVDGREVYKEKINPRNKVSQINVSALPQGLYLCRMNNGTKIETTKFIKQ